MITWGNAEFSARGQRSSPWVGRDATAQSRGTAPAISHTPAEDTAACTKRDREETMVCKKGVLSVQNSRFPPQPPRSLRHLLAIWTLYRLLKDITDIHYQILLKWCKWKIKKPWHNTSLSPYRKLDESHTLLKHWCWRSSPSDTCQSKNTCQSKPSCNKCLKKVLPKGQTCSKYNQQIIQ